MVRSCEKDPLAYQTYILKKGKKYFLFLHFSILALVSLYVYTTVYVQYFMWQVDDCLFYNIGMPLYTDTSVTAFQSKKKNNINFSFPKDVFQ